MIISGFIKNSFVDYPGKIASVIFTKGCNMDCVYCHNRHLLDDSCKVLDNIEIIRFLKRRVNQIDAVVISGGEPTIQKGLKEFAKEIKELGYLVKLDTNGTNPELVNELLMLNLIDYIAMDIKATDKKYSQICRANVNIDDIKKSISYIMNSSIDYEFRTTCYPAITNKDIFDIASHIKGANLFALQKYRNLEDRSKEIKDVNHYDEVVNHISSMFRNFELRGM